MTIGDLYAGRNAGLLSCRTHDPLIRAVRLMVANSGNAIAILEQSGRLAGILTDHDVMRALAENDGKLEGVRVSGWMSKDVVTVSPTASLDEALSIMGRRRIRHLVVAQHDRPLTIVGIREILAKIHEEDELEIGVLRDVAIARA